MPENGESSHDNDEQDQSGEPDYKVYRSRKGFFSRLGSPDVEGLRERAKRTLSRSGGDSPADKPESERRPIEPEQEGERDWRDRLRRVPVYLAIAAAGWILLSLVAFAVSAQLQKSKLADSVSPVLGGNPALLVSPQTILVIGTDARSADFAAASEEQPERCIEQQSQGEVPNDGCPGFRADTLMLVRAGGGKFRKLSIPRDTLAEVPDVGDTKINAAYAFGGAALQVLTVERFLGIDIDHVVILDFGGFEDFIDAIGGVEIKVKQKFCSDISGGVENGGFSLTLKPGEHTLNGEDALVYARTRSNDCDPSYDDLDRAEAQQQLLVAIKNRLLSPLRLPYNFIKGPIIGWTAPKAFVSDMGALTMPQLVISSAIAGSGETDVLCGSLEDSRCSSEDGSFVVPDEERRRAVDQLMG
jgi:LCP family protein required for cell wall assembly